MCKTLYEEFTKLSDKHEVSYIALTWISWLLPSTSISDNICCYYSWSTGKPNLHWEVDYNAAILQTNQSFQSWGWPPYYVQRELLRSSEVDCWIKGAIKWNLSSNPSTEYHDLTGWKRVTYQTKCISSTNHYNRHSTGIRSEICVCELALWFVCCRTSQLWRIGNMQRRTRNWTWTWDLHSIAEFQPRELQNRSQSFTYGAMGDKESCLVQ